MKWLELKNLEFQLIDIVNEPPFEKYLDLALNQYHQAKKRIFNMRGKSFKKIEIDIDSSSNEEIIQLLLSDGKLIKRPFLVHKERNVILGFNEMEYTNYFSQNLVSFF